jgi:alpha-aminoadipate carrier protein LysW
VSYDRYKAWRDEQVPKNVDTWRWVVMPLCPACETEIEIDEFDVDKGEIINCPECGAELAVVGLSPIELDLAPQSETEDWDDS